MFNSIYLDVAIGMVFIFLLYSLLATAIQELSATLLKLRGKYLKKAIKLLLEDEHLGEGFVNKFFEHPLISKTTFSNRDKVPSYIQPAVFATVVRDVLLKNYIPKPEGKSIASRIDLMADGAIKKILQTHRIKKIRDIDAALHTWFSNSMERLSGTYKRSAQKRVLVIGLLVAIAFNVDSVSLFERLAQDDQARLELVELAIKFHHTYPNDSIDNFRNAVGDTLDNEFSTTKDSQDSLWQQYQSQRQAIDSLLRDEIQDANNAIGIGWEALPGKNLAEKISGTSFIKKLKMLAGWIFTALAISLGAPFWFDLLKKFIRIRGSGVKPATKTNST